MSERFFLLRKKTKPAKLVGGGKRGREEDEEDGEREAKRRNLGWMFQREEADHLRPADQGNFSVLPVAGTTAQGQTAAKLTLRDERAKLWTKVKSGKGGKKALEKKDARMKTLAHFGRHSTNREPDPRNFTPSEEAMEKLEKARRTWNSPFSAVNNLPLDPSPLRNIIFRRRNPPRRRIPGAQPTRRSARLAARAGPRRSNRLAGRAAS